MKINNKIITISIAILFLFVIFQTSITSKIITNQKSSVFFDGYISGKTEYTIDGKTYNLAYAKIKIENSLIRVIKSDSKGDYTLHVKAPYPDGYYDVVASSDKIIKNEDRYYELLPQTKDAIVNFRSNWDIVNFKLNCTETTDKEKIKNSKIIFLNSNAKNKNHDTNCMGTIYGQVAKVTGGYSGAVIPFAQIEIEGVRSKICNLFGGYFFTGLKFGRTYTITADAVGYDKDSYTFILTEEEPEIEHYFYFEENDEEVVKNKNDKIDFRPDENSKCGTIYGNTGTSHIWGFSPVAFTKVKAGSKKTISMYPLGSYRITGLPLNKKIEITAIKRGYVDCTETVILTDKNPIKQVFLNMELDDKDVKSKNIDLQPVELISNKKVTDSENNTCSGCIIGGVLETSFFPVFVKGAVVTLKGKNILNRVKTSGVSGKFIFLNVPLGGEYTVTVRHPMYKKKSETVVLTDDEPIGIVSFYLYKKDFRSIKNNIEYFNRPIFRGLF